jgi:hypothetical protein
MRFAYADPPYLGCSQRHYGEHHDEAHVYDTVDGHRRLVERLCGEFPDGWALSLHEPSLRVILPMCPEDVRVCAWVKPFASFKPNVTRAWCWEPVIVRGGRPIPRTQPTIRDYVSAPITLRRGFPGAKPVEFCFWLFDWLNMDADDEFVDLFPGSGAVAEAYRGWLEARTGRTQFGLFAEAAE